MKVGQRNLIAVSRSTARERNRLGDEPFEDLKALKDSEGAK